MAAITQKEWLEFLTLLYNKLRNSQGIKLTGMPALTEINNFILFRFLDNSENLGLDIPDELKFRNFYLEYATDEKINQDKEFKTNENKNCCKLWEKIYRIDHNDKCLIQLYLENYVLRKYMDSSVNRVSIFINKSEAAITIQDIINNIYNKFDGITFDTNFFNIFGSAYEEFKTNVCSNSGKHIGKYFTNVFIKKIIMNELKPKHNEIFYEPCAGQGDFVHTANNYVIENEGYEKSKIFKNNMYANECNPEIFRSLIMNMLFHNIPIQNINELDSLETSNLINMKNKINVIGTNYTNYLFGLSNTIKNDPINYWEVLKNGKNYIKNASAQFIIHIYHSLVNGGRTGFVCDKGIINNGTNKATSWETKLRKFLFENNNVYRIINLPQGTFTHTNSQTCIIFMIKGQETQELKIYDAKFKDPKNKNSEIYVENNPVSIFTIEDLRENNYNINVVKEEEIKEGYIRLDEIIKIEKNPNRKASEGKENGTYIFLSPSQKKKYSEFNDYNDYRIIIGSSNKVHYYKNFACSSDNIVLYSEIFNTKYIYYYLKMNLCLIKNDSKSNTFKHISKTHVGDIKIHNIPSEQQEEIVLLLDDIFKNNDINLLNEYIKDLDIFKLLVHKKYFDFQDAINLIYRKINYNNLYKLYDNDKKSIFNIYIKTSNSNMISINDLVNITKGSFNTKDINNNGKYPYYNSGYNNPCGKHDKYTCDYDEYILYIKDGGDKNNKYNLKCGMCKPFYVRGKIAVMSSLLIFTNKNANILNLKYLYYYLEYNRVLLMDKAKYNSGLGHISIDDIKNFKIPIIDIDKQIELNNNINYIEKKQKKYQEYIKFLDSYIDNIKIIINNLNTGNVNNNINNINININNQEINDQQIINQEINDQQINNQEITSDKINHAKNTKTKKITHNKKTQINTPLQEISNLEIPKSINDIKTKKDKKYNIPYFTATKKYYCQEATYTGPHILCTRVTQNQGTLSLVDGDFSASSDFIIIELKEEYTQYYEQVIEYIKNNFDYNKLIDEDPVFNTKNERTNNIGLKHLKKFVINL